MRWWQTSQAWGQCGPSPDMPSQGTTIPVSTFRGTTVPCCQKDVLLSLRCPTRTGYGMSSVDDCGMATGREWIGSNHVLYLNFCETCWSSCDSMVDCGTDGECWVLKEYPLAQLPTTPSIGWMHEGEQDSIVEYQSGHWYFGSRLKATALNSRELLSILLSTHHSVVCIPQKTPKKNPLFHEIPLKTLITWTRWWHLTAIALTLVLKKKVFGVVAAYLKKQKHRVDNRIAILRTDWSARGRELNRISKIGELAVKRAPRDTIEWQNRMRNILP